MPHHPLVTIQVCIARKLPAACRVAPCRAHNDVSWRILRCIAAPIATQTPPQVTIQSLYRDTLHSKAMRARATARLALRSAVSWPSNGHIVAQARPCRGRVLAVLWPLQLCPAAMCHDTIHCIVTQMGSSPFPISFLHIFFSHHFFSHSSYLKTTKKNVYIFFFNFQYNKINS